MKRWLGAGLAALLFGCSAPQPPAQAALTVKTVGPAGGTVNGQGAARGAQVNIPPGALAQETPVAVGEDPAPPEDPPGLEPAGPSVLCSPEGLTFNRPATLVVPYGGISNVSLYEAGGGPAELWRPSDAGVVDLALHVLRAPISHFSRYRAFRVTPPDAGFDAGQ